MIRTKIKMLLVNVVLIIIKPTVYGAMLIERIFQHNK